MVFSILLVLALSVRSCYQFALMRGKKAGYQEGYLAGQDAHRNPVNLTKVRPK